MSMTKQQAIDTIANAIVVARDFCADEGEAARDAFADLGFTFTQRRLRYAQHRANGIWRTSQRDAGVPQRYWR